jgi:hypothetical protein
MKKLLKLVMTGAILVGVSGAVLPVTDSYAVNVFDACNGSDTTVCKAATGKDADKAPDMIKIVINTLLYVLGIISVIMIVIGGIRYTTSNGDPSGLKTARDTIIYSVVGLVVAILSYSIVNFVVGRF